MTMLNKTIYFFSNCQLPINLLRHSCELNVCNIRSYLEKLSPVKNTDSFSKKGKKHLQLAQNFCFCKIPGVFLNLAFYNVTP